MFKKILTESEINHLIKNYKPFGNYGSDSSEESSEEEQSIEEEVDRKVTESEAVAEPKPEEKQSLQRVAGIHVCDVCNKGFKNKYNLKLHKESVHLKIRKFVCDHRGCGRRFAQNVNLAKHKQIGHQNIKFKCSESFCGKEFTTKQNLKFHFKRKHLKLSDVNQLPEKHITVCE